MYFIIFVSVVGDNRGTVSLYRIFNPVTITHQVGMTLYSYTALR